MRGRGKALDIAHRGFAGRAPENTLAAARAARAAGADAWELDVAASSDGVLVVLHDDGLERTTDAAAKFPGREPWSVYDFTRAELESLDAGSWYERADRFGEVAAGRLSPASLASFRGERLPTLEEALDYTRAEGWQVNVEIKDARGRACEGWIAEKTVELVSRLGLLDAAIISSFNHDYLLRVRRAEPLAATAALVETVPADPVGLLRGLGAAAFHPPLKGLGEGTVAELRRAGFGVNVWTVDSPADMERLLSWGVTGIITNFPDRAEAVLRGRP